MDNWTVEMVEDRLVEAAVGDAAAAAGARAWLLQHWPKMVVEFADRVGQQPEPMRLPPPSPAAITRMEEALLGCAGSKPTMPSSSGRGRIARRGRRSAGSSVSHARQHIGAGSTG